MTEFVGDWSNHDHRRGSMDWAAMARDGIRGGWHKSSDGLRYYTDPYFAGAIGRMRTAFAGGPVGAYHVLWGNRDIRAQILWWFEILDATAPGWRGDPRFHLVTDNEPFGYNTPPTVAQINLAGDIIRELTGKTMLAYCPPWHYGGALAGLRYPLISSNYGGNPVAHYRAAYPGDGDGRWTSAAAPVPILQYGSRTRMGPQSTCDANAIRDPKAWAALTAGKAESMSIDQDPSGLWLIYRVEAMAHMIPSLGGSAGKGKPVELVAAINRIDANTAASRATDAANATAIAGLQATVGGLVEMVRGADGNVDEARLFERIGAAAGEVKALVEQAHQDEMAAADQRHQEQIAALADAADMRIRELEAQLAALRPATPAQG